MILDLFPALGGLGLFLLGVHTLTDGLRGLAGPMLRRVLTRFTRDPVTGALTGATVTAILQSSSATTVAAVGFVGAGLMSFPQALGIVFGANIGTTMTGWIVALVGFKLDLGVILLPGVLIGVLLHMFGRGRLTHVGSALAGFALLFVGVEAMRQGLGSLESVITPATFPADTLWGRLQLVLIGAVLTIVTQSSSAGVAMALAAIGSGLIAFPQAAAMIIGMDVGTTFTALLATVGGSTASRRTGIAHVVYNVLTGVMAFILLTPYTLLAGRWLALDTVGDAQVAAVAFHTLFNALGVVLVVGVTQPFARLIVRMVPERGAWLLRRLDDSLLAEPHVAVDAEAATVADISTGTFAVLADILDPPKGTGDIRNRVTAIREALDAIGTYAEKVVTTPRDGVVHARHQSALHALDHLDRLYDRMGQQERIDCLLADPTLRPWARELQAVLRSSESGASAIGGADALRQRLREQRHVFREETIAATAAGLVDPDRAPLMLDAVRWLHRVAYHVWRIEYHVQRAGCAEEHS